MMSGAITLLVLSLLFPAGFSYRVSTAEVHTSYLSILVHRRIIEVYKKYTKKLSELATK